MRASWAVRVAGCMMPSSVLVRPINSAAGIAGDGEVSVVGIQVGAVAAGKRHAGGA